MSMNPEPEDDIPFETTLPPIPAPPVVGIIEHSGTLTEAAADHAFVLASNGTVITEIE